MTRWLLVVLASIGAAAPIGRADSIWARRDPRYGNMFQDFRARNVGDVLTVVISETTVANEQDQRALSKTTNGNLGVQFGSSAGTSATPFFSETSNRTFAGNAQLTVNRVFTDQMAVVVVDMMPNGNLVVEGYRSQVVAGEERVLRVTGIVRPADIGTANTVASGQIANFRISYLGRGPVSRTANQNYLGRVVNAIWPW